MSLTPTSTEFLLLQQKVETLQFVPGATTTAVAAVVTFWIALFLALQFFSWRRVMKNEVTKVRAEFKEIIDEMKNEVQRLKKDLEEESNFNAATQWGNMAVQAVNLQMFDKAFLFKVNEAYYSRSVNLDVTGTIQDALGTLEFTDKLNFTESEKEDLNEHLDELKEDYPNEITKIQTLLSTKLTNSSNTSVTDPAPQHD